MFNNWLFNGHGKKEKLSFVAFTHLTVYVPSHGQLQAKYVTSLNSE